MTEEQKNNKEQFQNFCEGMDFAGMMEAMMSQKEELCGCGCIEMMKKVMSTCCSTQKEDISEDVKEDQTANH